MVVLRKLEMSQDLKKKKKTTKKTTWFCCHMHKHKNIHSCRLIHCWKGSNVWLKMLELRLEMS